LVKQIQIILDDDEYLDLLKVKGKRTWKELLLESSVEERVKKAEAK